MTNMCIKGNLKKRVKLINYFTLTPPLKMSYNAATNNVEESKGTTMQKRVPATRPDQVPEYKKISIKRSKGENPVGKNSSLKRDTETC